MLMIFEQNIKFKFKWIVAKKGYWSIDNSVI